MTTLAQPDELRRSAQRMRAIRRALGFTQRDWSYYLRVAVNTVSAWENGHTLPSPLADARIREVASQHGLDLKTLRRFE
jgi:DNA-binding transcriptional regulator YiaG